MADPRFCIGYALAPKKQQSFIRDSLLRLAASRGIDLVGIDTDWPLLDQGPFDCVLHKFYGEAWRRELVEFGVQNPMAFVLDSPDSIDRLHNRISMLQVVSELKIDNANESFGIPNQIVIYDKENLLDRRAWGGLKFPVIAKPLVADGSAKSHKMALVFNHECLNELKPPIVLQEFVNHGEVIFKVFVVGQYVRCVKRKSLPDEPELTLGNVEGLLSFSQVSNMTAARDDEMMQLDDTEMPPLSFLTDIARELRQSLNLNLFNFDMIRDSRIGTRYLIIDINYFPGYSKMPGYEEVLTDFFCDLAQMRNEMKNNPDELERSIGMLAIGQPGDDQETGTIAIDQPGPVQGDDQETGTIAIDQPGLVQGDDQETGTIAIDQPGPVQSDDQETGSSAVDEDDDDQSGTISPGAVQSDDQETGSSAVDEDEDDESGTTLNDEDEDDDPSSDEREVKVTPVDDDDW